MAFNRPFSSAISPSAQSGPSKSNQNWSKGSWLQRDGGSSSISDHLNPSGNASKSVNRNVESPNGASTFEVESQDDSNAPFIGPATQKFGRGGGGFRSIDEKFSVNPSTGTASLSIPIHTSPGRAGFGPNLALSYDSGVGNGTFGLGWSIAQDSVTRKTNDGIPTYRDSDVFILSRQEDLVPSGTVEVRIKRESAREFYVQSYQPRVLRETSRIERWTSRDDEGDVYWRTISADNATRIFGDSPSSRIYDDSFVQARIYSWLLSESYDARGNAIQYLYKQEDSSGVPHSQRDTHNHTTNKYLKSIKYGNVKPNRDVKDWSRIIRPEEWLFEVILDYGEYEAAEQGPREKQTWTVRKDPFSRYNTGFEIRTSRLCRSIYMIHRFPENGSDLLVSSASFAYKETARGTFLKSVASSGHMVSSNGVWITESSAPIEFTYSSSTEIKNLRLQSAEGPELYNMQGGANSRWIDLDGEGSPGLLRQMPESGGAWTYQRNENAASSLADLKSNVLRFGAPVMLGNQPSLSTGRDVVFEDLNGNGLMNIVAIDKKGKLLGFHERYKGGAGWTDFQPFKSVLNIDRNEAEFIMMDVTGDGLQDVVQLDDSSDAILWYPSLAKDGFGTRQSTKRSHEGPNWRTTKQSFGTGVVTYLADMSGDGLDDIVQISDGAISYWPNLGYGRFGGEITMSNAPVFDRAGFDPARLQLADLDGSGTTDMIYLPPGGGATFYYNNAGNGWSKEHVNMAFPETPSSSSAFTIDLFGRGTSCLCTWGSNIPSSPSRLHFVDLAGGTKPNLLTSYTNGCGLVTSIEYQPSTKFYLEDQQKTPWPQPLPFPVQCVSSLEVRDEIAQTRVKTKYAYHDGYFDGLEKEFRGFGMVETWVDEDFAVSGGNGTKHKRPTVYTRSWYFTGSLHLDDLSRSLPMDAPHVQCKLPVGGAASQQKREIYRALKGTHRRSEVFVSGSETALHHTTESSYQVVPLQEATTAGNGGVSRITMREKLSCSYENGTATDARIQHDVVLAVNEYGDTTKSMSISYGRGDIHADGELVLNDDARAQQKETIAELHQISYTNTINIPDSFRKPLPCSSQQYRLSGLKGSMATFEELSMLNLDDFESVRHNVSLTGTSKLLKTLVAESRVHYSSNDPNKSLQYSHLEEFSVEFQQFSLCLTSQMLEEVTPYFPNHSIGELMKQGGYTQLENPDQWWAASSRLGFQASDGADDLEYARSSFYTPNVSTDAFGNQYTAKFDRYSLLLEQSSNPEGSTTTFTNDYRTLQSVEIKDCNSNRQQVLLNAFSEPIGHAMMGKVSEQLGDSLDGFEFDNPPMVVEQLTETPTQDLLRSLLGQATTRTIMSRKRYYESNPKNRLPNFTAELVRQEPTTAQSQIMLRITYFSGRGNSMQTLDWITEGQWRASGRTVRDSSGATVRKYQSRLVDTTALLPPVQPETSVSMTYFLDAVGRQVGTLTSDGRWTKTRHHPWSRHAYSVGNTVLESPSKDADIGIYVMGLDASYVTSWYDIRQESSTSLGDADAAKKSLVYAGKFNTEHFDTRGRTIMKTRKFGPHIVSERMAYDSCGHLSSSWDTADSEGRLSDRQTQKTTYDLAGTQLSTTNMDSGTVWSLSDIQGRPMISRNSRGTIHRVIRDNLRRVSRLLISQIKNGNDEILYTKYEYSRGGSEADAQNSRGRLVKIFDQAGVLSNDGYDFKGNLLGSTRQLAENYKTVLDWTEESAITLLKTSRQTLTNVNALNLPTSEVNAVGNETTQKYDAVGRVASVQWRPKPTQPWTTYIQSIQYGPDDQPTRTEYGNGAVTSVEYDEVTRKVIRKYTTKPTRNSRTKLLEDWRYSYDCTGRITSMRNVSEELVFYSNAVAKPALNYTYDELGRLIQTIGREKIQDPAVAPYHSGIAKKGGVAPGDQANVVEYLETYKYDISGNILQLHHEPVDQALSQAWTRTYSYQEVSQLDRGQSGNRLTSTQRAKHTEKYGYDLDGAGAVGCMTSISNFSSLTWDLENRLRSTAQQLVNDGGIGGTTWHVYDFKGDRVRKVTDSAAVAGSTPKMLKETTYAPSIDITTSYNGRGEVIKTRNTAAVGSVALIETEENVDNTTKPLIRYQTGRGMETDDQGNLITYEEYSAFGTTTYIATGDKIDASSRYRYASYERDTETGFYYCKARFYAPWLCRWISADPAGHVDGPNLYAYCRNDPVNLTDPGGTVATPRNGDGGPAMDDNVIDIRDEDGNHEQIVAAPASPVSGGGAPAAAPPMAEVVVDIPQPDNENQNEAGPQAQAGDEVDEFVSIDCPLGDYMPEQETIDHSLTHIYFI